MRALLFVLLAVSVLRADVRPDWDAADRAVTRLAPSAFGELPGPIRAALERRGCTIPQPHGAERPSNVVRGRFTDADRNDWAVLCSVDRVSRILVFRGGSDTEVAELASSSDSAFLQTVTSGTIGFSRAIDRANGKLIQDQHLAFGGPNPPPLDHEGINDAFVGKGSSVWYWHRDRWLELTGSD